MQAQSLIHWPQPVEEYVSFLAQFLALGAVGFRYAAVRGRLSAGRVDSTVDPFLRAEHDIYSVATKRAAIIGLLGALVQLLMVVRGLPAAAARKHLPVMQFLTSNIQAGAGVVLLVVAVVGLAIATSGK